MRRVAPGVLGVLVAVWVACAACTGEAAGPVGAAAGEAPRAAEPGASPAAARLTLEILAVYPHDPAAFTQGLVFAGGALYESTGLYGESSLRRLDPTTGEVLARRDLAPELFGEGLAAVGERLVQLTWREGLALSWDRATFEPLAEARYPGEGWGLAYDGERLVMSDGSDRLTFRDPESFAAEGDVLVSLDGRPVFLLNELEWVGGELWANVLGSDVLLRIDPASGRATGVVDLAELRARLPPAAGIDVLNGIAWWPERGSFLVTGKRWPRMFEIRIE